MKIKLENVRLYAYHGLHAGEDIIGNEYEVNLSVFFLPENLPIADLNYTVDYSSLYSLIKQRMMIPSPLLETIATDIASEIFAKFLIVEEVNISISKLHAPIPRFEGKVGVEFNLKRGS